MRNRLIVISFILMSLVACSAQTEERLSALETQVETMAEREAELEGQLSALQAQAEEQTAGTADVAVAQYIMDTSGFHGMEESLNESGEIDPSYLGAVNRARKVLANTQWPEELAGEADSLVNLLSEFAAALEADDGDRRREEAARLAAEVHEAQHDFSHAIDNWLSGGVHEE